MVSGRVRFSILKADDPGTGERRGAVGSKVCKMPDI